MDNESQIPQIKPQTEENGVENVTEVLEEAAPKSILDPEGAETYSEARAAKVEQEKEIKVKNEKGKKIFKKILLGLLIFVVVLLIAVGIPSFLIYSKAKVVYKNVQSVQTAVNQQNLPQIKKELANLKQSLGSLNGTYKLLAWTKILPIAGDYWSDGQAGINAGIHGIDAAEISIEAVEPYADIIGFTTDAPQAQSGEETANDRLQFIVETIGSITPKVDKISEKALAANAELSKIDPDRYPEKFGDTEVREKLRQGINLANEITMAVANSKPLLEAAPYLLGTDSTRTYLILFQNDKELRPTGGFITAYSIARVNKGKFEQVSSNDIYNLDAKYKPAIEAPEPIVKYIKGPYVLNKNLRLRDMNFSPDFKESMDMFSEEAGKVGIKGIDGIIAVDTQVVVNLLKVLGQIGVPGFGNFSAENDPRCDCPQVVYELESFADVEGAIVWSENEPGKIVFAPPNYENRKKIVGPLMNSILSNALGQPKEKLPALFEAGWKSMSEKHVLLYVFDEKAQKGAESFNIAGRISKNYQGDYLHISDANLGGRKSNLYVTQEVHQEVKIARDGTVEKTLEITYSNPQDYDGWLNSVLPNWTRVYVPKGSELLDSEGFEDVGDTYEEFGKTVFSGGFQLRPKGVKKIVLRYKLPNKVKGSYNILIQKQPGLDAPLYTITVGRQKEELYLRTDKEFKFRV